MHSRIVPDTFYYVGFSVYNDHRLLNVNICSWRRGSICSNMFGDIKRGLTRRMYAMWLALLQNNVLSCVRGSYRRQKKIVVTFMILDNVSLICH